MSGTTDYVNGQFCWVTLLAKDQSGAKAFYGKLFGWETDDVEMPGGPPYTMFTLGGKRVGGLVGMDDAEKSSGMPPMWHSYINVDDADAATSRAVQLGGTVLMPPIQVSDAGRMAMIQDPTGAAVLFWQKQNHGGAQLAGVPNTWNWNELYAGDPETAMRFFAGLFGWTYVKEPSARHDYWIHHVGDRMNGGIMRKPPEMQQAPSHWTVYFDVADLSAALDALSSLGGAVCVPPFAVSVGTIAVVSDPQGAMFCLIQMRTPAD